MNDLDLIKRINAAKNVGDKLGQNSGNPRALKMEHVLRTRRALEILQGLIGPYDRTELSPEFVRSDLVRRVGSLNADVNIHTSDHPRVVL